MKRIAVLGAGVMGHSISLVFAQHGYVVRLCDLTDQFLDRAIRLIKSTLETLVEFKRLSEDEIPDILKHIQTTTDLAEALKEVDVVIEAVPEIVEVKKELFSQINRLCSKETLLASNASGLDIFSLAEVDYPERLVITHWFSPPHCGCRMRVLRVCSWRNTCGPAKDRN